MSDAPARWSRRDVTALSLVLLFALLCRIPTINRTFDRDPEGCGAYYGQLARNYLRYDLTRYYLVPIQNIGVNPDYPTFYPNHPPLLPLLIAGTYKLIGWNPTGNDVPPEWATRLSTTFFTIGCSGLIFIILRNRDKLRSAIFGGIFFAITPMALTFGSQPDVINSQLCFFVMLTVMAYLRFVDAPSTSRFVLLILAFAPAAMTDWPAFHVVVALVAHFLLTQPMKRWPWILGFGFIAAMYFLALYAQIVAVMHDWSWMRRLVQRRALSNQSDRPQDVITITSWLGQALWRHGFLNVSLPIAALAFSWTAFARRSAARLPIILLLAWTLIHVIVGRQGVFVHEWWWWPLMPAAALAAGVAFDSLISKSKANWLIYHIAIVVLVFNVIRSIDRLDRPKTITRNAMNYTLPEIGDAIRLAAKPNECVLLAESDESLGLWYYADRPIKRNVWSPEQLEAALSERLTELPFGYTEPHNRPPVALVIPVAYAYASPGLRPFVEHCRARYRTTESALFITVDLTTSTTPATTTPR